MIRIYALVPVFTAAGFFAWAAGRLVREIKSTPRSTI